MRELGSAVSKLQRINGEYCRAFIIFESYRSPVGLTSGREHVAGHIPDHG